MKSLNQIRKEVEKIRTSSHRARYPKDLIASVVAHIRGGVKITKLSVETGICYQTLRMWMVKNAKSSDVAIHRWPEEKKVFRLHYPDGRWVEGLSIEDLQLLRVEDVISQKGA